MNQSYLHGVNMTNTNWTIVRDDDGPSFINKHNGWTLKMNGARWFSTGTNKHYDSLSDARQDADALIAVTRRSPPTQIPDDTLSKSVNLLRESVRLEGHTILENILENKDAARLILGDEFVHDLECMMQGEDNRTRSRWADRHQP